MLCFESFCFLGLNSLNILKQRFIRLFLSTLEVDEYGISVWLMSTGTCWLNCRYNISNIIQYVSLSYRLYSSIFRQSYRSIFFQVKICSCYRSKLRCSYRSKICYWYRSKLHYFYRSIRYSYRSRFVFVTGRNFVSLICRFRFCYRSFFFLIGRFRYSYRS